MPFVVDPSIEQDQRQSKIQNSDESSLLGGFQPADYALFFTEKKEELAAIIHQLDLAIQSRNILKEEVEGYLGKAQHIYEEVTAAIATSEASATYQFPQNAIGLTEADTEALNQNINALFHDSSEIAQQLAAHFSRLSLYATSIKEIAQAPSILDIHQSLGRAGTELMSVYDKHHERLLLNNVEKTRARNKQLAEIQKHLSSLYEQRAKGETINRELFEEKYNQTRTLLDGFIEDMGDIRSYVDLPELKEDFVATEENIRSFCQKLELMKIRVQGSISDLANEMHKFVQTYTIIIDIMKNMLEMDRNEREAIVRRTGQ